MSEKKNTIEKIKRLILRYDVCFSHKHIFDEFVSWNTHYLEHIENPRLDEKPRYPFRFVYPKQIEKGVFTHCANCTHRVCEKIDPKIANLIQLLNHS